MPKRVDANQPQITKELRDLGFSVAITSDLGKGFPDIEVGFGRLNLLIEIKPDDKKKLTEHEKKFFENWQGQVSKNSNTGQIIDEAIDTLLYILNNGRELHQGLLETNSSFIIYLPMQALL